MSTSTDGSIDKQKFVEDLYAKNLHSLQTEHLAASLFNLLQLARGSADLYLFELIQNALDAGATSIGLSCRRDGGKQVLLFGHNNERRSGRPLSSDEVRALCGVCLSTKSLRNVGFMGIGFKSVFKVFGQVDIHEMSGWSFTLKNADIVSSINSRIDPLAGSTMPVWNGDTSFDATRSTAGWSDTDFTICFRFSNVQLVGAADILDHSLLLPPRWNLRNAIDSLLPKRHSSEATPLLPELALFFSVLAMRGLERFWLQDRLIELSCGNGLVHATCNRAMRDVHFAEYALSVGDDEWRAYCQFRGTEGSAEIRDSFRVIAMVVSSAPKVDHWLWTMLPTSTRCPFAFNCDAPFILDIDRQHLRQDGHAGVWNRQVFLALSAVFGRFCATLVHLQQRPFALTSLSSDAFIELVSKHVDAQLFLDRTREELVDVEFLAVPSSFDSSLPALSKPASSPLLLLPPDVEKWLCTVDGSAKLLPHRLLASAYTTESVWLLEQLGFAKQANLGELCGDWLACLEAWLPASDEARAKRMVALLTNVPNSVLKHLPIIPVENADNGLCWQTIHQHALLSDVPYNIACFFAPKIPSVAEFADVAVRSFTAKYRRYRLQDCGLVSMNELDMLVASVLPCAQVHNNTVVINFQHTVLSALVVKKALLLIGDTWIATKDGKNVYRPLKRVQLRDNGNGDEQLAKLYQQQFPSFDWTGTLLPYSRDMAALTLTRIERHIRGQGMQKEAEEFLGTKVSALDGGWRSNRGVGLYDWRFEGSLTDFTTDELPNLLAACLRSPDWQGRLFRSMSDCGVQSPTQLCEWVVALQKFAWVATSGGVLSVLDPAFKLATVHVCCSGVVADLQLLSNQLFVPAASVLDPQPATPAQSFYGLLKVVLSALSPAEKAQLATKLKTDPLCVEKLVRALLLPEPALPTAAVGIAEENRAEDSYTGIAAERYVFENICRVLSLADLGDFVKTNQAPNSQGFSVSLIAPQKHAEVHWCNGGGEASHPYDLRVLLRDHASSSAEQEVLIEVKGTVRQAPILSAAQVALAKQQAENYVVVIVEPAPEGGMKLREVIKDPVGQWQSGVLKCDWMIRKSVE